VADLLIPALLILVTLLLAQVERRVTTLPDSTLNGGSIRAPVCSK
jgi:hypothetical protein